MKLPNLSGYAIRCWGYRGSIISNPKLAILHPAVSILQHITKKPSETIYLNLRKASVLQVMAILPNSRPNTGWRRGYLTNELHKKRFLMLAKLRYSRTTTIKLWWRHLGAQLPGSMPHNRQEAPRTMFSSQNHRNDSKIPAWSPKK